MASIPTGGGCVKQILIIPAAKAGIPHAVAGVPPSQFVGLVRLRIFAVYRDDLAYRIPDSFTICMLGNSPIDPHVAFGRALRRPRQSAGRSQEQLGLEAGVQRNFISLIETGQNQPTITTICRLATALGMKASDLVADAEIEALPKRVAHR